MVPDFDITTIDWNDPDTFRVLQYYGVKSEDLNLEDSEELVRHLEEIGRQLEKENRLLRAEYRLLREKNRLLREKNRLLKDLINAKNRRSRNKRGCNIQGISDTKKHQK